jgi:hypothetical protein
LSADVDQIFAEINSCYYLGKQRLLFSIFQQTLEEAVNKYFKTGQGAAEHDAFFGRFTPIWMDLVRKRRYFEAISLWNSALLFSYRWEEKNKPNLIHKGTPYYFLGVTAILNNELENGFLLMHQAMKEDKRQSPTAAPKTPAYFFVTLDFKKQEQFFKPKVEEISDYLSKKITIYQKTRAGALTLDQFKAKFLECPDLAEEVFLFVYNLFQIHKMIFYTDKCLKKNTFSALIHAGVLSSLCLILDKVVENKNPLKGTRKLYISNEVKLLSGLLTSSINDAAVGTINGSFSTNFSTTLIEILHSKYVLNLSKQDNDFALAYGIRNFGAHRIEDQPVIYDNFPALSQRLMNNLFFAVERLY